MQITRVEGIRVVMPIEAPILTCYGALQGYTRTIIKLHTTDGIVGIAETHGSVTPQRLEALGKAIAGLTPWDDPHNLDHSYMRVRVRQDVIPVLERELGPGVTEALARTAEQLREDAQAFDEMIEEVIEDICEPAEAGIAISVRALEANPTALRNRIIRFVVHSEFGVALERVHVLAVARLVTDWHGQKPLDLPGGIRAAHAGGRIVFSTTGSTEVLPHDH